MARFSFNSGADDEIPSTFCRRIPLQRKPLMDKKNWALGGQEVQHTRAERRHCIRQP